MLSWMFVFLNKTCEPSSAMVRLALKPILAFTHETMSSLMDYSVYQNHDHRLQTY